MAIRLGRRRERRRPFRAAPTGASLDTVPRRGGIRDVYAVCGSMNCTPEVVVRLRPASRKRLQQGPCPAVAQPRDFIQWTPLIAAAVVVVARVVAQTTDLHACMKEAENSASSA